MEIFTFFSKERGVSVVGRIKDLSASHCPEVTPQAVPLPEEPMSLPRDRAGRPVCACRGLGCLQTLQLSPGAPEGLPGDPVPYTA